MSTDTTTRRDTLTGLARRLVEAAKRSPTYGDLEAVAHQVARELRKIAAEEDHA